MAIEIKHTYTTQVQVTFYSDEGIGLRANDCGTMDDIAERACEILVKHNFSYVDVTSRETGELLMIIERT